MGITVTAWLNPAPTTAILQRVGTACTFTAFKEVGAWGSMSSTKGPILAIISGGFRITLLEERLRKEDEPAPSSICLYRVNKLARYTTSAEGYSRLLLAST